MTLWSDANTVQRKAPQPPVGGLPTVVCALDLPWAFLTPVFQPKNPVHLSVYHSKNLLILFALTLVSLLWAPRAPTAQNSHGVPGPLFSINRLFLCPHGRNHQGSVRITSGSFTSFLRAPPASVCLASPGLHRGDSPLECCFWPITATSPAHNQTTWHACECMTSWGDLGSVVLGHIAVRI